VTLPPTTPGPADRISNAGAQAQASEERATASACRLVAVVLTYRRPEVAREAVNALLAQSRPPDRIILVENTEEPEMADAFTSELVEHVASRRNTGAAGGFALGARVALQRAATHVVFVDDDCTLAPDVFAHIERAVTKRLPGAVVGPVVVEPGGDELVWPISRPDGSEYGRASELPAHPLPTRQLAFHGLTVSAEALRRAGGPRPDLFFGGEDIEFCLRLAGHGYGIFCLPEAVAEHHPVHYRTFWLLGRRKVAHGSPGVHYYVLRNRLLIWRLHRRDAFLTGVVKEVLRSAVGALVLGDERLRRLRLVAKGVRDGLVGDPHRKLDNAVSLGR
jgi:rhamnopyranosyl-N-acetylglucosaminyl-diphospho-decaprenol beta-1,3/1,4-galactofuranosyltransferase